VAPLGVNNIEKEAILVSTGTRGDVAPLIAYGLKIKDSREKITLFSNSDHSALALKHGICFEAISEPDWPQVNRDEWAFFNEVVAPGYYNTHRLITAAVKDGRNLEIVARSSAWGAQYVAEKYNLPFTRIALQPCAIRKNGHPADRLQTAFLNRFRKEIGLHEIDMIDAIPEAWENTISLFPRWFGEPQSTWPESGYVDDFLFLDEYDYEPDPELRMFLNKHVPILISLGSGIQEIDVFWRAAEILSQVHNLPVLFISPYIQHEQGNTSLLLLRRSFIDHGYVVPKCGIFINNGGIGAIAQGIRAKVHQIICPIMWDQPDNARRVEINGLSTTLTLEDISTGRLLEVIRKFFNISRKPS